ncbi:MAG: hypothetical protein ACXWC4_14515 [Telluria sp.]
MDWLGRRQEQLRLGQILLGKKLISEEQLEQAIAAQRGSGKRLGEVLTSMKLLTEAQIRGAVRRQRNLRMAAAVAASLLGPIQAFAASAAPVPVVQRSVQETRMRPMSDAELGEVAGQGGDNDEALRAQARAAERLLAALQTSHGNGAAGQGKQQGDQGVQVLGEIATLFNPLLGMLNAKTSMKDVQYDPEHAHAVVNKDGSVTFFLPSSIGEIRLDNIRVGQDVSGPSFGSIAIHNIDLRGSSITVRRL